MMGFPIHLSIHFSSFPSLVVTIECPGFILGVPCTLTGHLLHVIVISEKKSERITSVGTDGKSREQIA